MRYIFLMLLCTILFLGCKTKPAQKKTKSTKQPNQNFVPLIKEINYTQYPVFTIGYPEVWENNPSNHPSVLVSLRDPEEITDAGQFYTNLYIGNMLFAASTPEELEAIYLNDFSSHFEDLSVLDSGMQTIDGKQYVWIEFNYTWFGINIKGIEYWIENQNNSGESTIISAKTLAPRYDYYKPIFLDMVNSFKVEF